MHDEGLPVEVAGFLRQASTVFAAEVPAPGPELRLLLDAGRAPVAPAPPPARRPSMFRSKLATVPGKLALAAIGLTFATTGLAAANALPSPAQQAAATLADVVGVDVPAPGDTTPPPTDVTTIPPTDGTTIPPTTVPSTTVPSTTVPSTTVPSTTVPSTTVPPTTVPGTGGSTPPPPATSAQQAAHIHDFDAACGNHGQYVSYVAKNGSEPPCATSVRDGSASTPPTTGSTAGPEPTDAGKPAKAPKPANGKPKG